MCWNLKKAQLVKLVTDEVTVKVDHCINVWCLAGSVEGHLALINVFKTDTN